MRASVAREALEGPDGALISTAMRYPNAARVARGIDALLDATVDDVRPLGVPSIGGRWRSHPRRPGFRASTRWRVSRAIIVCGVGSEGSAMEYVGDMAAVQRNLARSHDMCRRRSHVLAALAPVPGEEIREVGCGGGLLLRELGRAVAPVGSVLGVDLSVDQVAAATEACIDVANARIEVGSATALDVEDGRFDASVSTQVLEYVDDIDTALAELARATRAGGRLLNVATNWATLFVSGGDAALTKRIVGVWDRHAPHPNLPVELPNMLRRAGFTSVLQTPLPLANRTFNRSTWGFGIAHLLAAFASSAGDFEDETSARWPAMLARRTPEEVPKESVRCSGHHGLHDRIPHHLARLEAPRPSCRLADADVVPWRSSESQSRPVTQPVRRRAGRSGMLGGGGRPSEMGQSIRQRCAFSAAGARWWPADGALSSAPPEHRPGRSAASCCPG